MALLIIFLSKTRINFIYVNITYAYVTEFTLAEQSKFNIGISNVQSKLAESNLHKPPKYNRRFTLDLRNVLIRMTLYFN